jgi:hypothetical protein
VQSPEDRRRTVRTPRLPGAGTVVPDDASPMVPAQVPPASEPPPVREPERFDVIARFGTAAGALAFAEQVMQAAQTDDVPCYRSGQDESWWISARLPLGSAREMAGLGAARLYVRTPDGFIHDRGWGEDPGGEPPTSLPDLAEVPLLGLIQVAGVHPVPTGPLREAYVLLSGYLVPGLLRRAHDLRLQVTYQQVVLEPLFRADAARQACYAVRLAAPAGRELPVTLLAAIQDDPFALLCRAVEQSLLIGYGTASPLSDRALARLVAAADDSTWLLAAPPDGCARLTWIDGPMDAANLVRLGPVHALTDLDGTQPYAEPVGQAPGPGPRPVALTLVRARAQTRVRVDAVLLDDADLDCLPLLLAGEPLADVAFLIRGTGRHLLSAPGGLLVDLGVGEPLTCIGPGSVYLPVGYRLEPPVGPAARAVLFQPDASTAQVMLRDARLAYDLDAAEPVWRLWAGPPPALDQQLPRSAVADLQQVAREIGERTRVQVRDWSPRSSLRRPTAPREPEAGWRREADQAERRRDYAAAAELYARHKEPLRAARMWEREAEENY